MELYQSLDLELHKNNDLFLGLMNVPKYNSKEQNPFLIPPKLVIILDKSGSMGDQIKRMTQIIIPQFLNNIYKKYPRYRITLMTFCDKDKVRIYKGDANYILNLTEVKAGGMTYMQDAVEELYNLIFTKKINQNLIRLLTISDGELYDQNETVKSAEKLKQLIKERNIVINSHAIRLFTTGDQPDTRGLSSMLQLSTIGNQNLLDIDCNQPDKDIINSITNLYINDNLDNYVLLKTKEKCIQQEPWLPTTNSIYLFPGKNSFWIRKVFPENTDICPEIEKDFLIYKNNNEIKIKCKLYDNLTENNYQTLIQGKFDFYFKQLKILKVVNTEESIKEIDKIISFINELEENVFFKNSQLNNKGQFKLYERTQYLKASIRRRQVSLINKMQEIRNDDKINKLNSKQQAEYLREIDTKSRTARGLAKRAIEGGIDFDEVIRKEVIQIANNIHELDDINDSQLTESFYSACNTLDGIKAVYEFYQESKNEKIFEETTANDILKLINIVGIAGYASIGDYPDPMTYRIENLYPSTFVSLSDILTVYEIKNGNNLKEIGRDNEINICIPYFEDEKILKFLMKYAPKLLEYNASVNMRRILADIPYTNEYTILAGIFALIPMILKDKKEIYIKIFVQLTKEYLITSGDHFVYVLDLLEQQKNMDKDGLSLFIANNGITNMTSPLLLYLKNNKGKEVDNMVTRIIRATVQFEIYQYIRKNIRMQKADNPNKYIEESLIDLLGINLDIDKTKIPDLFVDLPKNITFDDKYNINYKKYDEIMSNIYWVDYIAIIPQFLKVSLSEDYISEFKKIEIDNITEEIMRKRLGINFDTKLFKLYSIVQSFLQYEKADRVDTKLKKMKILDLGIQENAEKYVKNYIRSLHKKQFEKALKEKQIKEKEIISQELANKLVEEKNMVMFIYYLQNGIEKGSITYKFNDHDSLGFLDTIKLLSDKSKKITLRKEKIFILCTGKDKNNNIIWNKGNAIQNYKNYYCLKNVLSKKEWNTLAKEKRDLHIYREEVNRRGHSNANPSYWALGYNSIQDMKSAVSEEEFNKYVLAHQNCCGFYKGVYIIMRNCYKKDNLKGRKLEYYNKYFRHLVSLKKTK